MRHSLYPVPPRDLAVHVVSPAVLPLVRVPAPGLRERLTAHPAFVRFFPGVGQLVLLERGHLGKPLGAPVELAGVRPLPCVRPYVVLEVPRRGECLPAVGVRADEWALPGVDPPVDVEVLRRVEPLAAAREIALAWTIGDVDLLDVGAEVGRERERPAAPRVVTFVRLVLAASALLFGDAPARLGITVATPVVVVVEVGVSVV